MPFTQGHALLIGVGSHKYHPEADIPISVCDVEAVAEVLQDEQACAYPQNQVHSLIDSAATKEGLLAALDQLATTTNASSTVFLFFCGHGALGTDGNYYLVSHDVRFQDNRVMANTGVSEAELLDKLRAIQAQRLLIIIDACYAGNLSPIRTPQPNSRNVRPITPPAETAMALLGSGSGRILITSCRESQVSYIGSGTISIFTKALVDGLRGRGVPNDQGLISAFGLYEHLYAEVRDIVSSQIHAVQEPELTIVKGVGPFAIALYKGATHIGDLTQEPLPQGSAVREIPPEKSARYFKQHIVNTGGNIHVVGGNLVGRDQIIHGDQVRGDTVYGSKIGGDNISVDRISDSQGIAIGRAARATVVSGSTNSATTQVDLQQLRAALEELWDALGTAQLSRDQTRITQTAASIAVDSVADKDTQPTTVIENVKKIGETLKETNTFIEEGTTLWKSIRKVSQVLGPVVGSAHIVANWFGMPF